MWIHIIPVQLFNLKKFMDTQILTSVYCWIKSNMDFNYTLTIDLVGIPSVAKSIGKVWLQPKCGSTQQIENIFDKLFRYVCKLRIHVNKKLCSWLIMQNIYLQNYSKWKHAPIKYINSLEINVHANIYSSLWHQFINLFVQHLTGNFTNAGAQLRATF